MAEYFIGAPVPRDIIDIIEKSLGGLHAGTPELRKNFHIWLGDLGELSDDAVEKVTEALERVSVTPFYISFEGLGTIGGNAPTVLYAELEQARGLKSLHRLVGREVREAGVFRWRTRGSIRTSRWPGSARWACTISRRS